MLISLLVVLIFDREGWEKRGSFFSSQQRWGRKERAKRKTDDIWVGSEARAQKELIRQGEDQDGTVT